MNDEFYRAFEDRHRGDRWLIKSRLRVYLPFITPLLEIYQPCNAVDLGCGRGEWLELLNEEGFVGHGVDLDDGMLEACRELGLEATRQDAVQYLKQLPDESLAIVTGFHVAEHIPFLRLRELAAEACRVLQPAGLLILETPNPENLVVGATNFYLDPTHIRPLPPDLLLFLTEYSGFERNKIMRLNRSALSDDDSSPSLSEVLKGVSPDYAVIAQKDAPPEVLQPFNAAINRNYGTTLDDMMSRYENTLTDRIDTNIVEELRRERDNIQQELRELAHRRGELEAELKDETDEKKRLEAKVTSERQNAERLENQLKKAEKEKSELRANIQWMQNEWEKVKARLEAELKDETNEKKRLETELTTAQQHAAQIENRLQETEEEKNRLKEHADWLHQGWNEAQAKIDELNGHAHHWWTVADALNHELQSVYKSKSWRITWPLRKIMQFAKWLFRLPVRFIRWVLALPKRIGRGMFNFAVSFAEKRPGLKARLAGRLNNYPRIKAGIKKKIQPPEAEWQGENSDEWPQNNQYLPPAEPEPIEMSATARRIYHDLNTAIEKNNRK